MGASGSSHRIRLRGPWTYHWLDESEAPLGVTGMVKHPDDWQNLIGSTAGRMQLTRRFHAPSNLDPHEVVFIVLSGVEGIGEVRLNGQSIGRFGMQDSSCRIACPLPLPCFNELTVTISFDAATDVSPKTGLHGVVELEICPSDDSPAAEID